MIHLTPAFPIILYIFSLLKENEQKVEKYLAASCRYLNVSVPLGMLMSLIVIHISGIEYLSHYQTCYGQILNTIDNAFPLYGSGVIRRMLSLLPGSMITWKLLLLQRYLVMQYCPQLLTDGPEKFHRISFSKILDIDGHSFVSYSDKREGSLLGFHRRRKGKPTLQSSASFLGNIFIDFKLFRGDSNVCIFLQKAVKRVLSMGYRFSVVRADTIYGNAKNLRFLESLSLHYIMGINVSLIAIREGIAEFKKLARAKSGKIIHIAKGSAILDLGLVNVAKAGLPRMYRRVILCRRIHRRRKKGKTKIKLYHYAIVTDLSLTPRQAFQLYHQRQKIENGFKELIYHYAFHKLASRGKTSLKANELWMVSKIFAMSMAKIFAWNVLPERYKKMRRSTLIRQLFANTLAYVGDRKVHLLSRPKRLWHLRRIFAKIDQNRFTDRPFIIRA